MIMSDRRVSFGVLIVLSSTLLGADAWAGEAGRLPWSAFSSLKSRDLTPGRDGIGVALCEG